MMGASDNLKGAAIDGSDAAAAAQVQSADRSVRMKTETGRGADVAAA